MNDKNKQIAVWIVRALLILAVLGVTAWIISNSLDDGTTSSEKSEIVTDIVQDVVDAFVPEEKEVIVSEHFVRKLAHFTEYAILGVSLFCAYLSFSFQKENFSLVKKFCFIPALYAVALPFFDELVIQNISVNRGASPLDSLLDIGGAFTGMIVSLGVFFIVRAAAIHKRKSEKDGGEKE